MIARLRGLLRRARRTRVPADTVLEGLEGLEAVVDLARRRHGAPAQVHVPPILQQCVEARVRLPDQVAYLLATADHECGFGHTRFRRSEPLVEDRNPFTPTDGGLSARVHTHGRRVSAPDEARLTIAYWDAAYGGRLENRRGTDDAARFRGRGYVQLTGRANYRRMTELLVQQGFCYGLDGVRWGQEAPLDLIAHPEHVSRCPRLAARILVAGSMRGVFTGRSLGDHVHADATDFEGARRVINGTDRAAAIASIARRYAAVLRDRWPVGG